jgi:predicted MPP superfamily phosphohydrolase
VERLRIVQMSDVHLGYMVRLPEAERIAKLVEEAHPDLIVATGDVPDASEEQVEGLHAPFARLAAPLGKYAVTGNHEYYAGIGNSLSFLRKAGFTVLRGEEALPGGKVRLVGVSDRTATRFDGEEAGREVDGAPLLARPSPLYTVLLRHQPLTPPEEAGKFDLQLSGHTHNGQIWPFRYASRLAYPQGIGLVPQPGGSFLYVNRGAGTWGPPMRFLTPPEVTVIDLVREKKTP